MVVWCRSGRNRLQRGEERSQGVLSGPAPSGNHPLGLRLEPAIPSTHELLGYTCSPFGDWYTKLKLYTDLIPEARLRRPSRTRIRAGSCVVEFNVSPLFLPSCNEARNNRVMIDKFCECGKRKKAFEGKLDNFETSWFLFKGEEFLKN